MDALAVAQSAEHTALQRLLAPEPLPDGREPEQRVISRPVSWNRYLAFDQELGNDRPGPRLYYLDGELEIMTTSIEHERIKKWIAGFVEDYFLENDVEVVTRGQATMRLALKTAGAEPDESWCLGERKEFPDLVLEVALTAGGIDKLEIYSRFKVPEVWIWRGGRLLIFVLAGSGQYESSRSSRCAAGLDPALIEQCLAIPSWQKARKTFREKL